ncbi:MAG: hypothetical protein HYZ72_03000 [Deltaproteobacteria bacterium]|nr:hypothetical protein [Deltaproteobacteria bacterium]
MLRKIGYQHLGGQRVKEVVRGGTATVVVKARIRTLVGITEQTEVYLLKRMEGRWLIDHLEVQDEVAPGEGSSLALAQRDCALPLSPR